MNALKVIKTVCAEAIDTADDDPHWRNLYCAVVDPSSVMEMASIIESLLAHAEQTGNHALVEDVRRRIGPLG